MRFRNCVFVAGGGVAGVIDIIVIAVIVIIVTAVIVIIVITVTDITVANTIDAIADDNLNTSPIIPENDSPQCHTTLKYNHRNNQQQFTQFFNTSLLSKKHFPQIRRIGMQVPPEESVDSKTAQKQGEKCSRRITPSDPCAAGSEQESVARRKAGPA